MGDRILIIEILKEAARELSDHPDKYSTERFDEYGAESAEFNFKKVTTRICRYFIYKTNLFRSEFLFLY